MGRLRKRLEASGPGVVIAVIALIFALAGTAFAAAKLNSTQKKEVKKIAKQFAGQPGANGATGATGAQGPVGAKGADGAKGATGATGPTGPEGPEGLEGVEGAEGAEGSPWTAGGTLPPGSTETGVWAMSGVGRVSADLSFPIPLGENFNSENVHFKKLGGTPDPACPAVKPSGAAAAGKAPSPGVLCIYYAEPENGSEPFVNGPDAVNPDSGLNVVSRVGGVLYWTLSEPEPEVPGRAVGSFAVTECGGTGTFACP
jgi:hypothetical protein